MESFFPAFSLNEQNEKYEKEDSDAVEYLLVHNCLVLHFVAEILLYESVEVGERERYFRCGIELQGDMVFILAVDDGNSALEHCTADSKFYLSIFYVFVFPCEEMGNHSFVMGVSMERFRDAHLVLFALEHMNVVFISQRPVVREALFAVHDSSQ